MLALFSSLLIGTLVGLPLAFFVNIGFGIFCGFIVTLVAFFIVVRKTSSKLQQLFNAANMELQKQNFQKSVEMLKQGYSLKHWGFLVTAQIDSQIGVILYTQKKFGEAYKYLRKANPRIFLAYCMLIVGHIKNKKTDEAESALRVLLKTNKKEAFVYSFAAYLYKKEFNDSEKAMSVIKDGLKKLPNNEKLKEHHNALQNKKRFKMSKWGDMWLQLMLDKKAMNKLQKKYMKQQQKKMKVRQKKGF